MDLDLVDGWLNLGVFEERLQSLLCPVRHANRFGKTLFVEIFHGSPCWFRVLGKCFLDNVLIVLVRTLE